MGHGRRERNARLGRGRELQVGMRVVGHLRACLQLESSFSAAHRTASRIACTSRICAVAAERYHRAWQLHSVMLSTGAQAKDDRDAARSHFSRSSFFHELHLWYRIVFSCVHSPWLLPAEALR